MMPLASGSLPYSLPWSHVLRHLMVNSYLRVPSSLRSTRKSPSTCLWMGHLVPHLYLVREAILGKPTRRDWDSMNCPQPFHVELWLIVKVTSAFLKGNLTRVLRDSVCDFACDVGDWFDQDPECGVGVELAWQVHVLEARSPFFFSISSHSFLLVPALLCLVLR